MVYLCLCEDVNDPSSAPVPSTFGLLALFCAGFYGGYSASMPWRSNVGAPFSKPAGDGDDCSESPEDSELAEWDDSLVELNQHLGQAGEGQGELDLFADGAFHGAGGDSANGSQLEVVSEGSEPFRRRPETGFELRRSAGPDKSLFFSMMSIRKPSAKRPLFQPLDCGMNPSVFRRKSNSLPMPWLTMPTVGKHESLQGLTPTMEAPERTAVRTPFHHQRLLTVRLAQTDDQMRAKAMRRLRDLILAVPSHTQLGRALLDTSGQLTGEDRIASVFADAFRSRATSTLVKRSLDYYKMAVWMDSRLNLAPMALSESVVYSYLGLLEGDKCCTYLS